MTWPCESVLLPVTVARQAGEVEVEAGGEGEEEPGAAAEEPSLLMSAPANAVTARTFWPACCHLPPGWEALTCFTSFRKSSSGTRAPGLLS